MYLRKGTHLQFILCISVKKRVLKILNCIRAIYLKIALLYVFLIKYLNILCSSLVSMLSPKIQLHSAKVLFHMSMYFTNSVALNLSILRWSKLQNAVICLIIRSINQKQKSALISIMS